MPAFFSFNVTPSVTRDNASIEAFNTTLDVQVNVTREFDVQTTAIVSVDSILTNIRGFDLSLFDTAAITCDAVATKRIDETLPAIADVIADNGAIRTTSLFTSSTAAVSFLGGRLIDNIVNARYSNVGYVQENYVGDEPAAPVFATLRAESDITILLDVFVTSTVDANITVDYNPAISITAESNLTCAITGLSLIQMTAFTDAAINIDYTRTRDNDAAVESTFSVYADTDITTDIIKLVVSAASVEANIAKILGGIVVGDLPSAFTVACIGDDLILEETQAYIEVQSTLSATLTRRLFGEAHLVANGGVLSDGAVLHIDEFVYVIPAEGWEYKIEGETRYHTIIGESNVRKIAAESRVKTIKGESGIHIIT